MRRQGLDDVEQVAGGELGRRWFAPSAHVREAVAGRARRGQPAQGDEVDVEEIAGHDSSARAAEGALGRDAGGGASHLRAVHQQGAAPFTARRAGGFRGLDRLRPDFVVEASGRHRGKLNLERDGLGPVVAVGRWIGVTTRSPAASTLDRLAHGADVGLLTVDEADTLRAAYNEMFGLLFRHDVEAARHGSAGSPYVRPESLDTLSRRFLREAFRAIGKVQTRLEAEWVSRLR